MAEVIGAAPIQSPAPVRSSESLKAPRVDVFDDLADLILLDPIHDVNEKMGWPVIKEAGTDMRRPCFRSRHSSNPRSTDSDRRHGSAKRRAYVWARRKSISLLRVRSGERRPGRASAGGPGSVDRRANQFPDGELRSLSVARRERGYREAPARMAFRDRGSESFPPGSLGGRWTRPDVRRADRRVEFGRSPKPTRSRYGSPMSSDCPTGNLPPPSGIMPIGSR